jgi:hypothetical protein
LAYSLGVMTEQCLRTDSIYIEQISTPWWEKGRVQTTLNIMRETIEILTIVMKHTTTGYVQLYVGRNLHAQG